MSAVPARAVTPEKRSSLHTMNNGDLEWITNFIWGIADDVLHGLYQRANTAM